MNYPFINLAWQYRATNATWIPQRQSLYRGHSVIFLRHLAMQSWKLPETEEHPLFTSSKHG